MTGDADVVSTEGSPPPRFEDLSTLLRETFWRVDPLGIADEVEFTWSEYHDIADSAAQRAADGEDTEAIARAVIREFREDWGIEHPEETARAVAESVELYRRRPAVVAQKTDGEGSRPVGMDDLREIGSWLLRARPDRVSRFQVRALDREGTRGSMTQLEIFPVEARRRSAVVEVVEGCMATVEIDEKPFRELELGDDVSEFIDDLTSHLLRAFPVTAALRDDHERLGERIRTELGGLGVLHVEIPETLLPALTMDAMAYGRRLGLLPAASAVSASLWRYEAGFAVTAAEQRIAFALSEESRDVEDWLDAWAMVPACREDCERLWVAISFHALLMAWTTPSFEAFLAAELDGAWGDITAFSRTIHRSGRLFRGYSWLRRHLEADLSAEIAALVARHIADDASARTRWNGTPSRSTPHPGGGRLAGSNDTDHVREHP